MPLPPRRHLKRLKSKSAGDRMLAMDGLAAIGAPAAHTVPLLLPLLRDPDPAIRRRVARALPQIVPDQSEAPLFEAARNDTDRDVRQAATEGLRDETHLVEIVRAEADASLRWQAAKRIKDAKLLAALAGDKDAGTRRAVLAHMDQGAIARLARELPSAKARRSSTSLVLRGCPCTCGALGAFCVAAPCSAALAARGWIVSGDSNGRDNGSDKQLLWAYPRQGPRLWPGDPRRAG